MFLSSTVERECLPQSLRPPPPARRWTRPWVSARRIKAGAPRSPDSSRTAEEPLEMEHTELIKPETLEDLIKTLHKIFESDSVNVEEVQSIMEAYESNPQEWMKFAKFDQYRYTRNLVDEGNGKFNLMILCWGEGHGSSIHDHTDAHCFMKLLQGQLKETLFDWPDRRLSAGMVQKSQRVLLENQCAYINDAIGLHRVENVSHTESAVSLHLYSPPFQACQTFDQRTGHRNSVKMTFWSKYGERTPYDSAVSQENN